MTRKKKSRRVMLERSQRVARRTRGACSHSALVFLWNLGKRIRRRQTMAKRRTTHEMPEQVAGNGLLHRRYILQGGAALAGAAAALATGTAATQAQSIGAAAPPWMLKQGTGFTPYGVPSHWRNDITRIVTQG